MSGKAVFPNENTHPNAGHLVEHPGGRDLKPLALVDQAAATPSRKRLTSPWSCSVFADRSPDAARTSLAEDEVWSTVSDSLDMLDDTDRVPSEARATFWEISLVAAPCSSTAAAMVEV